MEGWYFWNDEPEQQNKYAGLNLASYSSADDDYASADEDDYAPLYMTDDDVDDSYEDDSIAMDDQFAYIEDDDDEVEEVEEVEEGEEGDVTKET